MTVNVRLKAIKINLTPPWPQIKNAVFIPLINCVIELLGNGRFHTKASS